MSSSANSLTIHFKSKYTNDENGGRGYKLIVELAPKCYCEHSNGDSENNGILCYSGRLTIAHEFTAKDLDFDLKHLGLDLSSFLLGVTSAIPSLIRPDPPTIRYKYIANLL